MVSGKRNSTGLRPTARLAEMDAQPAGARGRDTAPAGVHGSPGGGERAAATEGRESGVQPLTVPSGFGRLGFWKGRRGAGRGV